MIRDDYPPFIETLKYVANGLKEDFTPDRYDFYFEMLQDLPFQGVKAALGHLGRTCTFFPKPAEIRAVVEQAMAPQDAAERAWERFRYALQHVSVYDSVDFNDAILHAVVRSLFGGWPQTIEIQSARMNFVHADFVKAYTAFARTGGVATEPLLGLMPGAAPIAVPALAKSTVISMPPALVPSEPGERSGYMTLGEAIERYKPT